MAKTSSVYFCKECGTETVKWMGKCPGCNEWNSLVEGLKPSKKDNRSCLVNTSSARLLSFDEVEDKEFHRIQTSMQGINQVLGGGFVPGSFVLISGEPGVGKSTLFMQLADDIAKQGHSVIYSSGEESPHQLKSRATRLDVLKSNLKLFPETDLGEITKIIQEHHPDLVIIDSIQTLRHPQNTSVPGSISQVRECTAELAQIAKTLNVIILCICQINKNSEIAGPKALEHAVDTVLHFEGDKHGVHRLLYSRKNRFGELDLAVLRMTSSGLTEVTNPSEIFLEDRVMGNPGTTVTGAMEGTRPLLVEIQALLTPTSFGNARRMASGIETNRLSLIAAVLEKHGNTKLQMMDIYVKVIGGLKLMEPAADLALAMALVSSHRNQALDSGDIVIGEVGLTGELRRISRIEDRVKEAHKLGFKRAIIPNKSLKDSNFPQGMEIVGVETISEAIRVCFPARTVAH